jgi:hypothetical protein
MREVNRLISTFYDRRNWNVEDITEIPHRPGMYHVTASRNEATVFTVAHFTTVIQDGEVTISSLATEHVKYLK